MTTKADGCWNYNQSIGKYGASVSIRLCSASTPFSPRFWSSVKKVASSRKLAKTFGKYSRHRVNTAGLVPDETVQLDGNGEKGWYRRQGMWGRNGECDTKVRRRTHLQSSRTIPLPALGEEPRSLFPECWIFVHFPCLFLVLTCMQLTLQPQQEVGYGVKRRSCEYQPWEMGKQLTRLGPGVLGYSRQLSGPQPRDTWGWTWGLASPSGDWERRKKRRQ
ncbi:hypothetical protein ElyMa_003297200 [Elysia marginata]|uniref:Uncharacterized protein n=1 Tax=Elysia marginata TaxID=1093978 RepID=A0AAV4JDK0_9GAST|nr:hypothetical protein ElyMa_003297200 [Elysia marginata]